MYLLHLIPYTPPKTLLRLPVALTTSRQEQPQQVSHSWRAIIDDLLPDCSGCVWWCYDTTHAVWCDGMTRMTLSGTAGRYGDA